jgi:hypothetical protein
MRDVDTAASRRQRRASGIHVARDQATRADYEVAASSRPTVNGTLPTLKVVRLTDKRVIYPFRGCADMPLFPDAQSARSYAEAYGWQLVDGDLAVPE